ncbi:hypothetical protein [Aureimonas endophytica]|uniref:hypothetical protein n=1 Tax=Aureimonas endophytica TaxID=2027858 RepID=UPI0016692E9B|nr:hypothetical protein [Aureimonas endophytica]
MPASTLFDRAIVSDLPDRIASWFVGDVVFTSLNGLGLLRTRDPFVEAWMFRQQEENVLRVFESMAARRRPKPGRPGNGFFKHLFLAAAFADEMAKCRRREASYLAASRRLGVSKEVVKNGVHAFERSGAWPFFYVDDDKATQRLSALLQIARHELGRIEREADHERRASEELRRSRRFAPAIGGYFDAASAGSLGASRGAR